jgi:hypothetical protein
LGGSYRLCSAAYFVLNHCLGLSAPGLELEPGVLAHCSMAV